MITARITVDLPSAETDRRMGPIEWVRSLFGAQIDLRSGHEELTVSAWSLLEGVCGAFSACGITDAISLLVDKKAVYVDANEVKDDLPLVWKAAEQSGVLEKKFREMHLVLSHHEAGLHVLFDLRVTARVMLGEAEMVVTATGRPEEVRIHAGEGAEAYVERVRSFAKGGALVAHKATLDALVARVASALRSKIAGAVVEEERARVEVVRPDAQQIARFRSLPFGDGVVEPKYRAVPARASSSSDSYGVYYADPYWALTNWVMFDTFAHHHHAYPDAVIVDRQGHELGHGGDAASLSSGWAGNDAVSFSGGAMTVQGDGIPDTPADGWGSSDLYSDVGSSDAGGGDGGWGSSDTGSSDAGSSDAGSSDSGGSSCSSSSSDSGSSCSSGSSCGSSCGGGGCGGGGD